MKPKIIYALAISCLFLVSGCGSSQPENQSISLEEAKSAALDDAQLGIDEVEFLKTERNTDGDTSYYDIQFLVNGTIYKYQINTETGAILHVDYEAESASSDTDTPGSFRHHFGSGPCHCVGSCRDQRRRRDLCVQRADRNRAAMRSNFTVAAMNMIMRSIKRPARS